MGLQSPPHSQLKHPLRLHYDLPKPVKTFQPKPSAGRIRSYTPGR